MTSRKWSISAATLLLGAGLTVSDGELHRRQRRTIQPIFRHERIPVFAEVMVRYAERARTRWRDDATLDLKEEMEGISLAVIGETMFGANLEPHAATIQSAMDGAIGSPPNMLLPLARAVEKLPLPAAHRTTSTTLGRSSCIRRRSSACKSAWPEGVTRFLVLAGNASAGNSRVYNSFGPTFADIATLQCTENVIRESLRLYPPLWMVWRRAIEDYPLDGYVAPAGSIIIMSQHVMHRDERYFAEPLRFNPERWTEEFNERLPRFAYFPFGGGIRQCLGDRFGFMEAVLVLTTVVQKWRFRLVPGHRVVPNPLLTLRPKYGMQMIANRRNR